MTFEKLGVFYLGRPYDLENKKPQEGYVLYDSKDLTTHAVCVGMTGSGKTGLCINLLEEAAIDNIPSIVIDPKGDMANLLLTFPEFKKEDFLPWINESDASKKGMDPEAFATQQAELWKNGLASWGQDGQRIAMLKQNADFVIYTPGSSAGIPVSVLRSFDAPEQALIADDELLRERINTTVSSLLGLLGINADPIQSREHIFLSHIFYTHWIAGKNLDLSLLIQEIQNPPFKQVGVMDLEVFYPAQDRLSLSMKLNNLLAAPSFSSWMEGESLDIKNILYTPEGRPRVAIFSIAHLNDAERMFFVSLLLNHIVGWMRSQSGTTSLRALVYMDEIFGFFPPVANPPSKLPLLTLLKQARAYGVGVVLATQNPVDLDYKGLSNAGTWWIGRLQTERDKARVLEGLEGAAASSGSGFNRQRMEQTLAGLSSRIFLMHNVHDDEATIFETRWAMSYLRGPLTRQQIKTLMDPIKSMSGAGLPLQDSAPVKHNPNAVSSSSQRTVMKNDLPQWFVPVRNQPLPGQSLQYQPHLLINGKVLLASEKYQIHTTRNVHHLVPIQNTALPFQWDQAFACSIQAEKLEENPMSSAVFGQIPSIVTQGSSLTALKKDALQWLYESQHITLWKSPSTKAVSTPEEEEKDFRLRISQSLREQRDEALEKLRKKYAPKKLTLEERLRKAQQTIEREKEQVKHQTMQTAISVGATILGGVLGRRGISGTSIGRATTTARNASRTMKETQDVGRAKESFEQVKKQLQELESSFEQDMQRLMHQMDSLNEELEKQLVKPKKTDISIQLLALCWVPYWTSSDGKATPAY
ncbi:MAG TPA: DUF87 domain-containing protein [Caldisericia bacterium]|nr:DUF87 domain-containing protein [Caldisericia bacterium]